MVALIKLIGIVILILGVAYLLRPELMKQYMSFWTKNRRLYAGAIISAIIGTFLLLGATQCRIDWVVTVVGLWGLLKGLIILMLGKEKMASTIKWWQKKSVKTLRAAAIAVITIGALLIFAA